MLLQQFSQAVSHVIVGNTPSVGDIEDAAGSVPLSAGLSVTSFPFKAAKKPPREVYLCVCVLRAQMTEPHVDEVSSAAVGSENEVHMQKRYVDVILIMSCLWYLTGYFVISVNCFFCPLAGAGIYACDDLLQVSSRISGKCRV